MGTWERLSLLLIAVVITAISAAALCTVTEGPELARAVREGRPVTPPGPPAPPAPLGDPAPAIVPTAGGPEPALPCYPRRSGLRPRWEAPRLATTLARPAPRLRSGHPPGVAPAGRPPRPGAVYVVAEGDTFLGIVRAAYGTDDRWIDVWVRNRERLPDVNRLEPGLALFLPE